MTFPAGDTHNFGRRVLKKGPQDGPFFFEKPRTVAWENLFFGKDSPFNPILSEFFFEYTSRNFADTFLALEVCNTSLWSGTSLEVKSIPFSLSDSQLYELMGALLCYSYFFGIFDLHGGNVIPTNNSLIVIDCETVLGQMILPHESLLLPFKTIDSKNCGFYSIFTKNKDHPLSTEAFKIFISSYIRMFQFLFKRINILCANMELNIDKTTPIRIIIRDTHDYLNYLKSGKNIKNLLPEEEIQLNRHDVPYFFRTLEDERIQYFVNEETTLPITTIQSETEQSKIIDRFSGNLLESFMSRHENKTNFATTVLFLSKIFNLAPNNQIQSQDWHLVNKNNKIEFFLNNIQYTA